MQLDFEIYIIQALYFIDTAQNQIRMTPCVAESPNMKFNQKQSNHLDTKVVI
jgi:hypothetical protein